MDKRICCGVQRVGGSTLSSSHSVLCRYPKPAYSSVQPAGTGILFYHTSRKTKPSMHLPRPLPESSLEHATNLQPCSTSTTGAPDLSRYSACTVIVSRDTCVLSDCRRCRIRKPIVISRIRTLKPLIISVHRQTPILCVSSSVHVCDSVNGWIVHW